MRLDLALEQSRRAARPIALPYLMVDRARARTLGPTVDALAAAGAAGVELGYPFSDPIADGPTLSAAAQTALGHRTGWSDLLAAATTTSRRLPTAVMTYANPVWRHGLDPAMAALAGAGATGLIVPDLSLEESGPWVRASARHGLSLVLLAAPGTSAARVRRLARTSRGFLYLVSRYGTTGAGSPAAARQLRAIVSVAHRAVPARPVLVGFGIRDRATAAAAFAAGADGFIVGSALEERIASGARPRAIGAWFRTLLPTAGAPNGRGTGRTNSL